MKYAVGLVGVLVCLVSAPAEAQFRPVAVIGDPLPGHSSPVSEVDAMAVTGANQAAYVARAVDGTDVLAIDVSGSDSVIAVEGAPAAGGGTYAEIGGVIAGGTFLAFTTGSSSTQVLYGWSGSMGVVRLVAAGELLPDNGSLNSITMLAAAPTGDVLITDNNRWVRANYDGSVDSIARFGGPVPGNPDYTIDFAQFRAVMSDDGTITCWAQGTMGSTTRTFVVQGEPGAWTTIANSGTLPTLDSAGVGLLGAAPNGRIAYTETWRTGTGTLADPAIYHRAVKLVGGGGLDATIHTIDSQNEPDIHKIQIGGMDLIFPYELWMSDTGLLAGEAGSGTGMLHIVAYVNGEWRMVASATQDLPGVTGARVSNVAGIAGNTLVLEAGVGATSGVWSWTPSNTVPQLLVAPGAMLPGGVGGTATATNVRPFGPTVISADGQIGFGANYPDTVMGGTTTGAYLVGGRAGTADLEITLGEVGREKTDAGDIRQYVVYTIKNNGPDTASPDLAFSIADGGALQIVEYVRCTVNPTDTWLCSTEPLSPGASIVITVDVAASIGTVATITVSALSTTDPNLDNNAVTFEFETSDVQSGWCAASGGDGSLLALVGVVLFARRRRRRR